jgi:tripartite-type tricarboxylate transporter receptor subunit TctC
MTGLNLVHVPYRGNAPALVDLIAGQVEVGFDSMPATIEHVRAGQLRALAISTVKPNAALPGIPSISEFVPGYESSSWYGMVAPRNTPSDIVDKLNQEINAALADPKISENRRPWRHRVDRLPAIRQVPRRRNREMGEVVKFECKAG